jgi:IstB-like ATP binding protein
MRHCPVGDLLNAETSEKQARSIRYQLTIAKLPLAKDLDDFRFDGTPINETLVHDLAGGGFIAQQRNAVLVGGTGTGKTHFAIAIARSCTDPASAAGSNERGPSWMPIWGPDPTPIDTRRSNVISTLVSGQPVIPAR